MKTLFFFLILLLSLIAEAQNYRLFQNGTPRYFTGPYEIKAIKIDSVNVIGTDSLFYNFLSINENQIDTNNCVEIFGPSWIGERILIRSDSLSVLFNQNNDSIFIRPLSPVGVSWRMFQINATNYIQAKAILQNPTIINGSVDTIKKIILGEYNQGVLVAGSSINGKQIILSKEHGLYSIFPFREFPSDLTPYVLTDNIQLSNRNIYDFNIGDSLQYITDACSGFLCSYSFPLTIKTVVIANKHLSSQGDSLVYDFKVETVTNALRFDSTGYHIVSSYIESDSSSIVANLDSLLINLMPDQTDTSNAFFFNTPIFGATTANRYSLSMDYCNNICLFTLSGDYYSINGCFNPPFEPTVNMEGYGIGLGKVCSNHYECTSCGGTSVRNYLRGYIRGGIKCGVFDFTNRIIEINKNEPIDIYPNPLSSLQVIYIDKHNNKPALFKLFDITGKMVYSKELRDEVSVFDSGIFNSGYYVYKILFSDSKIITGKIIIQ